MSKTELKRRDSYYVFPESCWEQKPDDIRKYAIDTFAMGDDWLGKFDDLKAHCEVIYLDRTEGVSTTSLKFTAGNSVTP